MHRIWPDFQVTAIDEKSGKFQTRDALSAPMGDGLGVPRQRPATVSLHGRHPLWANTYDMLEDAAGRPAPQAKEKLTAKSVEPGKYDLVLEPSHLWLTIHESVGHATELDRVLGYEANYAGTSFATLDKWQSKLQVRQPAWSTSSPTRRSPARSAPSATTTRACRRKRWDLIKDGILVDYQTIRDQAHIDRPDRVATAAATPTAGTPCSSSACPTSRSRPAQASSSTPTR